MSGFSLLGDLSAFGLTRWPFITCRLCGGLGLTKVSGNASPLVRFPFGLYLNHWNWEQAIMPWDMLKR